VTDIQNAYDTLALLRNQRWNQQEALGLDVDRDGVPVELHPLSERWWFYQGQCEALASAMSILEEHGASVVLVATTAGKGCRCWMPWPDGAGDHLPGCEWR
jgi:hypothetical protein